MYEKDILSTKLLIQTIDRIFEYTSCFSVVDEFVSDSKTFDATLMNFVVLGETVGKLSEPFRNEHDNIEWSKVYAFRNIIAHDYFGIDEEEVWDIINNHLPKLKHQLQRIINGS